MESGIYTQKHAQEAKGEQKANSGLPLDAHLYIPEEEYREGS